MQKNSAPQKNFKIERKQADHKTPTNFFFMYTKRHTSVYLLNFLTEF